MSIDIGYVRGTGVQMQENPYYLSSVQPQPHPIRAIVPPPPLAAKLVSPSPSISEKVANSHSAVLFGHMHNVQATIDSRLSSLMNGHSTATQLDDGESKELASKLKNVPECCRCHENFSLSPNGRGIVSGMIRPLPCSHLLCQSCVTFLLDDQHVIVCPVSDCQVSHDMSELESNLDASTQYADSRPPSPRTNVKLSEAAVLLEKMKKVKVCRTKDCDEVPTHQCLDGCGYLCTQCDSDTHQGSLAEHKRETLISQQQKKQQVREATKKKRSNLVKSVSVELDEIEMELREDIELRLQYSQNDQAHIDQQSNLLKKLKAQIVTWEQEHEQKQQLFSASMKAYNHELTALQELLSNKKQEVVTAEQLPLDQTDDQFEGLIRLNEIREAESKLSTSWKQRPNRKFYQDAFRQLLSPTLLPSLTVELTDALSNKFLKESGMSLDGATLVYKASLHGWTQTDFVRQCLGGCFTLMLVKVAGNGFVFGAFIEPAIPHQPGVCDPNRRSFLFSLINQWRWPFRLSLTGDNRSAINVSERDVRFGYVGSFQGVESPTLRWPDLALFCEGKPANDPKGNWSNLSNTSSYRLDEWAKEALPKGFTFDANTFAGGQEFGASEIEAYQLYHDL